MKAAARSAPWRQTELTLTAERGYANPYTGVDPWAVFTHESGTRFRRQAFGDRGRTWRVRFASPGLTGAWSWSSGSPQLGPVAQPPRTAQP